ncbi:MAG: ABC transporter substrate-binding protein [Candidatus Sumerlaeaceae bacterium]
MIRKHLSSFSKIFSLALSVTLFLAGCLRLESRQSEEVIRLGFFANVAHAPAIIGVERGDFEKSFAPLGVKVQPVLFSSGPAFIEAIYASRLDIAYVGPGPAINGYVRSGGSAIRVVSGCAANGVAVVTRKDSEIRGWPDLAGKRVAIPAIGNTQFFSATYFLDRLTTNPDAKEKTVLMPVHLGDAALLLKKHQVDAAWLPEPWPAKLEIEDAMAIVGEERELWPEGKFPSTLLVVRREFAAKHPEWVKRFIGIHETLCAELSSETKHLAGALADGIYKLSKTRISKHVVARALDRITFTTDPLSQKIHRFYEMASVSGFLRRAQRVDLDGMFFEEELRFGPASRGFSAASAGRLPSIASSVSGGESQ